VEYRVTRKLQEQGGSYFVILPKLWVEAIGLRERDLLDLVFNGQVVIIPPKPRGEQQTAKSKVNSRF